MEKPADQSLASYLASLAAPTPAPGGGSAAAVAAGMAAALVEMVAGLSLAKQPDGGDAAQQQGARDRAATARVTLLQYAEDDATAYTAFIEALRLPKNTNEEREVRTVAISAAAVRAAEVPLQTLQVATAIANDAAALTDRSLASAASDLEVARRFARAAGRSAADNVEANLPYIEEAETRARLAQRTVAALADLDRAAPPSA
jgi:formiminotetrahydrofolate cyclodeaminase